MKAAALIPVKGFADAKHRLAPLLKPAERRMLAEAMMRDVVSQILCAEGIDGTFIVTGDAAVSELAAALGARIIREEIEKGETEAVVFATKEMKQMSAQTVLVLPADLPLLRTSDVESLLRCAPPAPSALLAPSHDRKGTNALVLSPPDIIPLRFGYDSFSFHMSRAAANGLRPQVIENERIALDIDEPRDLERFLSMATDGHASRMLAEMGVKGRFQAASHFHTA